MPSLLRLLRASLRPYAGYVALVVSLLLIQSIANLYLPNLNADIINNGVVKGDVGYIWRIGVIMLVLAVFVGILSIVAVWFASRASMGFGRDVRRGVFERVQQFSATEMNRFGTPSLITRNTNDVQQVQLFVQMALTIFVTAPIMLVGGIILAVREDVTLSAILIVILPLMVGVFAVLMYFAIPLFQAMQKKIDRITEVLREQITGVRVIRAFNRTPYERARSQDGCRRIPRRHLRLPGRGEAGAARPLVPVATGRDHRDHRRHGLRQDHAVEPHSPLFRRHSGRRPRQRRGRPAATARNPLELDRARSPAGLPLSWHDRRQPPVRQGGRHRGRAVACPRGGAGAGLRRGDAGEARGASGPGWHQSFWWPASATGDRPGA